MTTTISSSTTKIKLSWMPGWTTISSSTAMKKQTLSWMPGWTTISSSTTTETISFPRTNPGLWKFASESSPCMQLHNRTRSRKNIRWSAAPFELRQSVGVSNFIMGKGIYRMKGTKVFFKLAISIKLLTPIYSLKVFVWLWGVGWHSFKSIIWPNSHLLTPLS